LFGERKCNAAGL
jgi:hypothetical protein